MNLQLLDLLKKYGLPVLALVVAFAAGRWTMRSTVEKQYEAQLHEETTKLEESYKTRLVVETADLRKQLDEATHKLTITDKKTVTKPDGTVTVEEHTKVDEKTKTKETTQTDTTKKDQTTEASKTDQTTKTDQVVKSKETTTPPPSWRVYAATAVRQPTDQRYTSYGAGTAYSFGPVDIGGFGLYEPETKTSTLGITLGLSF